MESALTTIRTLDSAGDIAALVIDEVEAIGTRLQSMVPGFSSFWLAGSTAAGALEVAPLGSSWVCGSDIAFVLVTEAAIPAPTLRCLRAGIGLRLGGMRVRLRNFKKPWLPQQVSKHREGFEWMEARRLLSGDEGDALSLDDSFTQRPAPAAVENLCVDSLELMLRCYPDVPMLEREATPTAPQLVQGALVELARNLGDAELLMSGRFTVSRAERGDAHVEISDTDRSTYRSIIDWAYGPEAPLEATPVEPTEIWSTLRDQLLEILRAAVEERLSGELAQNRELLQHVRNCRRGLWSRIQRFVRGKKRAGGREYAQLLLLLSLGEAYENDRALLEQGARLLSLIGGPILANPDWHKLRREALRIEPWQHLRPTPVQRASNAPTPPERVTS